MNVHSVDVVIACKALLQWLVDTVVMVGWSSMGGGGVFNVGISAT